MAPFMTLIITAWLARNAVQQPTRKHCTAASCTSAGNAGSSSRGGIVSGAAGSGFALPDGLPLGSTFPAAAPLPGTTQHVSWHLVLS